MIILGKTNKDKGQQLERLTCLLLDALGYESIIANMRGAGGQEVDATADYVVPAPGGPLKHRLICECKAHRAPIVIPDWLKFLGKVYTVEAERHEQVWG